jgi:CBS domain containing-hemolysin-like protein
MSKSEPSPKKRYFRNFFQFILGKSGNLLKHEEIKDLGLSVSQILERSIEPNTYEEEQNILRNILAFGDLEASDVMINRAGILAAPSSIKFSEMKKIFINEGHSRLPIYKSDLDDIIGFIHIKDLFKASMKSSSNKPQISDLIRDIIFVPETIKLTDLLTKMKNRKIHIAIVLDEYGGTAGLVTIEDIVEELVGDIQDEHDKAEVKTLIHKHNDHFIIDAAAEVEDVEDALEVQLVEDDESIEFETIGGFIITQLGCIPKVGTKLKLADKHLEFEVTDATTRRVKQIRVTRVS